MMRMMKIIICTAASLCLLLLAGCKDNNGVTNVPPSETAPSIKEITPDRGKSGAGVTITGMNFGVTPGENAVTFNGKEAVVTAAGETELTAVVPPDAGSGPVAVTVFGQTATGPEFTWFPDNTRFVDGVNGSDQGGGNTCGDVGFPCRTIAHAIEAAFDGDILEIADGIYTERVRIDKSLTMHGAGEVVTIIQALTQPDQASGRVIFVPEGHEVSIEGVTIRHGKAIGSGQAGRGGGIRVLGSTLNLASVTLEDNIATYGGAMHISDATGTYTNVTIRNNDAVGTSTTLNVGSGGGIHNFRSTPVLEGVVFFNNHADQRGGGMWNSNGSSPTLTAVDFLENQAGVSGGGMYNTNSSPNLTDVHFEDNEAGEGGGMNNTNNSSPTLTDVRFEGNKAVAGGGIFNVENSSPTLTNVTFSRNSAGLLAGGMRNFGSSPVLTKVAFTGNSAGSYGGGVDNSGSSAPRFNNVTFDGNSAGVLGGGMQNFGSSPRLTNVTFGGNTATRGGGLSNEANSTPTVNNVTFSGNSATFGGGIYNNSSSPTLTNVIIWNNQAGGSTTSASGSIRNDGNSEPSISYSLIANSGGSGDWNGDIGVDDGNNIDADPLFFEPIDPVDAPTILGDLRLREGSPAIDAGDPDSDTGTYPTDEIGTPVDLLGNPRFLPNVTSIDIGAYENQGN